MEQLLWELFSEDTNEHGLPPGFRFHPTDEELITFYLASKVFNGGLGGVQIVEVDLNRCEPWELPDVAKMGEREWYFYSLRDRKYPTGLRTNRATGSGYWKATGKDREVVSASTGALVGMKKTLVFYMGRAPRGEKTKWVLHEYRLDGDLSCRHSCKEEWVICRIFHKAMGEKKNHFLIHSQTLFMEPPPPLPPLPPSVVFPPAFLHAYGGFDPLGKAADAIGKQYCNSKVPLPPAELQDEAVLHCNDVIPQSPFVFEVGLFSNPSIFSATSGGGGGGGSVLDVMPFGSEPVIM